MKLPIKYIHSKFSFIICLAFLFTCPSLANANVPIPALFGIGAPYFLSLESVGFVFAAIILLEATILHFACKILWSKCFVAVLIANVASSIIGLLIAIGPSCLLILFFLPVVLTSFFIRKMDMPATKASLIGLSPAVCIFAWLFLSWPDARGITTWCLYLSLVPAYWLSVVIEFPLLYRQQQNPSLFKGAIIANGASYIMLAAIMFSFNYAPINNPILTDDYLYMNASIFAHQEKVEKSMQLIQLLRKRYEDQNYPPRLVVQELHVAHALALKGHLEEARILLENIKKTEREKSSYDKEIERLIKAVEKVFAT